MRNKIIPLSIACTLGAVGVLSAFNAKPIEKSISSNTYYDLVVCVTPQGQVTSHCKTPTEFGPCWRVSPCWVSPDNK